jgi:hypothetical protein
MSTSVYAQKVRFGVKAGLNVSSLGGYEYVFSQEDVEFDYKPGLYAGVLAQIALGSNLGLETGLYYAQLGGKEKERDYQENYQVTATPSYLQCPVSVTYQFKPGKITLYPSVGLYAGYGLSGKIKTRGSIGSARIDGDADYFGDLARRFDVGGTVGLNLEYRKFVLGVGYDRGFVRVNKEKVLYDEDAYNSNYRVTLGFIF